MKLIKSFLHDQIVDSIAYMAGCFLIGVFYFISTGRRIEIIYPFLIALFIYLIWMLYRFLRYRKLHYGLKKMLEYHDFSESYQGEQEKLIKDTIFQLHSEYMERLSEAENTRKKDRRFLSMWIHNMKTPVTVTDLLLQRFEQQELDHQAATQALKEENKKLLKSLNQILNMIRLEEFAKDYAPEPVDLVTELNNMINKNKSLFIYNHVYPRVITELETAKILSDRKWNELMLEQIISNGVKYSKDEEGEAKNIYFYVVQSENKIILTIRDEGIGIPEHDLGKVCEPFFTGDNGRRGYQSSGIGLYFCEEVCKLLGHSLRITSKEGLGTSVEITYLAKL